MKNDLNIQKMAGSLSIKEKAKMMILAMDEELSTKKSTLTDSERDLLRTYESSAQLAEYDFYIKLRYFGVYYLSLNIEICKLKFLISMLFAGIFEEDGTERFITAMQEHYNMAYTLNETADKLTNEFNIPVLGEYYNAETDKHLESLEHLKTMVDKIVDELSENDVDANKKLDSITEAKIDTKLVNSWVESYKTRLQDIKSVVK